MKQLFGKPDEPISRSECAATLSLAQVMLNNIVLRGDLPEAILEHISEFERYIYGLKLRSTERDSRVVDAAIVCGLLPSFERSEPVDAGEALMTLISLGTKKPRSAEPEQSAGV